MALSRSLLAGHVFQSQAGRPRKHGQQRHLLCARDSARRRPAARRSPPPASLPAAARPARPPPVRPPTPASGPRRRKERLRRRGLGRTRAGREAGAPWRQHLEAFSTHTPRQNAPVRAEGRGPGGGWGPRLVHFVPAQPGKVSRFPGA